MRKHQHHHQHQHHHHHHQHQHHHHHQRGVNPTPQTSTPLPPLAEEEETELLEESGATPKVKPKESKWGSPKPPGIKGSESVDLQTLNSMLSKNKDNPSYVVKSKKSKFYGYTMSDIKAARDEILDRRKGNKQPRAPLPKGVEELDSETGRNQEAEVLILGCGVHPTLIQTLWLNSCT